MVIAILSLRPDQKIPRPFNRASSIDELRELLLPYAGRDIAVDKIDTEEPVGSAMLYGQRVKFFAFTER